MEIYHSETIGDENFIFEIQSIGTPDMTSLKIKYEDIDEYWDNGNYIANKVYPELRNYLSSNSPMMFDGANELERFNREQLFDLYDLLTNAIYRGWLEVKDK